MSLNGGHISNTNKVEILLNLVHDPRMKAIMNIESLCRIESLNRFLDGHQSIAFQVLGHKSERYKFIEKAWSSFVTRRNHKKEEGSHSCLPDESHGIFAPTTDPFNHAVQRRKLFNLIFKEEKKRPKKPAPFRLIL